MGYIDQDVLVRFTTVPQERLRPISHQNFQGACMKIVDTAITDVKIIEPAVFGDERGLLF